MLQKFLEWTALPMVPPQQYGAFHLTFAAVGVLVSVLLAYRLRNATEKQNRIVLLTVGLFLLVSEVYKQLFYFRVVDPGVYPWGDFPFQMCSVPMYLCLIVPFLKDGKLRQSMYDFMVTFNFLGGALSLVFPSGLLHPYWSLTLHAFIWHTLLVFLGLYLGLSGRGARQISDYKNAFYLFLVLSAMAFGFNLLFWKASGGTINMFFLGPADSSLVVFDVIAKTFGWYVNTPLYMGALALGAYLCGLPFLWWNNRSAGRRGCTRRQA